MASIRKEILLDARPEEVWDAVRDIGALHTRLVPGSSPIPASKKARASSPSATGWSCAS